MHGLVGERLAARPALGDVLDLADEVQRPVVEVAHDRRAHRDPHRVPVVVQVALLDLAVRDRAGEEPGHRLATHLTVVGMAQVEDRRGQQLGFASSEDLHQRAVHPEEATVDRGERHADRRVLERAAEPLLRFAQLGLRQPPVREVARADDDARDGGIVEQVGGHGLHDAPTAVGVTEAYLDAVGVVTGAGEVEAALGDGAVVGMDQVEHVGADQGFDVEAEDALGGRARVHEPTVRVDDRHDVVRVTDHRPEARLVALQERGHPVDGAGGASTHDARGDDRQDDDRHEHDAGQDSLRAHVLSSVFPGFDLERRAPGDGQAERSPSSASTTARAAAVGVTEPWATSSSRRRARAPAAWSAARASRSESVISDHIH